MMNPSYKQILQSVSFIAETIARKHYNHEQRNNRLSVLGSRILAYMQWIERFSCYVDENFPEQLIVLRSLYELTAPNDHYELLSRTHSDMRTQCWLLVDVAREGLRQWEKNEKRKKWRDSVSWQMEAEYVAEMIEEIEAEPSDSLSYPDGRDFDDFYPTEDDPNYHIGHDLEPGEMDGG